MTGEKYFSTPYIQFFTVSKKGAPVAHSHHDHKHAHAHVGRRPFILLIALTVFGAVVEFSGGFISGSIGLDADALHLLADGGFYLLAYWEDSLHGKGHMTQKKKSQIQNYGALLLVLAGAWTMAFSILRAKDGGAHIEGVSMFAASVLGLVVNIAMHRILQPLHHKHEHQDRKGLTAALAHNFQDMLSSVAVVVTSVLIYFLPQAPGVAYLDSLVGIYIGYKLLMMGNDMWHGKRHVH